MNLSYATNMDRHGSLDDDYPGGWFGLTWGAPICDDETHRDTPVGTPCTDCTLPINAADQGLLVPHFTAPGVYTLTATHKECFLRGIRKAKEQYLRGEADS